MKKSKKKAARKKHPSALQGAQQSPKLAAMAAEVEQDLGIKSISSQAAGYRIKLSDALLKCAKPLTNTIHASGMSSEDKDFAVQELMEKVAFFWNLTFFPYDEAVKKLFVAKASPFNIQGLTMEEAIIHKRTIKPIFEIIYQRKHELFPDDTRFVMKTENHHTDTGYSLSVASLDLKEHDYLLEAFDK